MKKSSIILGSILAAGVAAYFVAKNRNKRNKKELPAIAKPQHHLTNVFSHAKQAVSN
ncbi:MAG: hypothetical protein ABIO04_12660 [Ferruginibacter sp.]